MTKDLLKHAIKDMDSAIKSFGWSGTLINKSYPFLFISSETYWNIIIQEYNLLGQGKMDKKGISRK